jgi:hypothetical protein
LCEYKNDEVSHYNVYSLDREIEDFVERWCKLFAWYSDWKWYVTSIKYNYFTKLTDDSFLYPNKKPMKPKKEKQEVFINKFYPWEKVWFYHNDKIFSEIIDSVCKYERPYCFNVNWNMVFLKESEMFKTKSQLIKSLSKQWRQEVEDRILSLTK